MSRQRGASCMVGEHAASYLNDHLAGSQAAVELLEHLEHAHKASPIATFAAVLRTEIEQDRRELKNLMERLGVTLSSVRQAVAWLSEKLARIKLTLDDPRGDQLHLHEALEALSLGIEGKRLLWLALAEGAQSNPALRGPDYPRLVRRAEDQRQRVETLRLDTARAILGSTPEPSRAQD